MTSSSLRPELLDEQALYHHPFAVTEEIYGVTRSVIASAKLRPGGIDLDRYYIDFTAMDGRHTLEDAGRWLRARLQDGARTALAA